MKQNLPAGHIAFAALASEQALPAAARGDMNAAIAASDRSLGITEASGQRLAYLSRFLLDRANIELQMQRPGEASAHAARALALNQTAAGPGAISSEIGSASLARAARSSARASSRRRKRRLRRRSST